MLCDSPARVKQGFRVIDAFDVCGTGFSIHRRHFLPGKRPLLKVSVPKSCPLKSQGWFVKWHAPMYRYRVTRQQILDLYFLDARSKLIDLAAFLDRVERADGEEDFRLAAFRHALDELQKDEREKAKRVLLSLSDSTSEAMAASPGKGACGAWQ